MTLRYRIELEPDDNDTLLVTCPELPEVTTFGEDEADARRRAVDAIEEALARRIAVGANIPPGTSDDAAIGLPAQTALKVALYRGLRRAGMNRAELARRLDWNRESVDRLFRLDHNSKLSQLEAALAEVGMGIAIRRTRAISPQRGTARRTNPTIQSQGRKSA